MLSGFVREIRLFHSRPYVHKSYVLLKLRPILIRIQVKSSSCEYAIVIKIKLEVRKRCVFCNLIDRLSKV